jgi:predicted membrane protein
MDGAANTVMKRIVQKRMVMADGVPIPEMIGGAIIGALVSLVLAYPSELRGVFDPRSPTFYLIVAIAALIGAVVSFFLARERVVETKERLERGDVVSRRAA